MTLRHALAVVRVFFGIFFSLLGLAFVLHGANNEQWGFGALLGALGLTSLFLLWLSAKAGER